MFRLALVLVALLSACDCSSDPGVTSCATDSDCAGSQVCRDMICVDRSRTDGGPDTGGGGEACTRDDMCPGGVCVGGRCCGVSGVCGTSCCGAGEVCLASACVTPGADCTTTADCPDGEYCEPSLGPDPGGDLPIDAGRVCVGSVASGRCVALPPRCEDGGDPATCISDCEFRPEPGRLNAVTQWHWGAENAVEFAGRVDVWNTPTVGRVYDTNCDGRVDPLDPPQVIFVSANSMNTCCHCTGTTPVACRTGVLRVLDGPTGTELWSLDSPGPGSSGFSGVATALGDINDDGVMDIVATTGEGFVVLVDGTGVVLATSDLPIPSSGDAAYGWGGGLAIADLQGDGSPEIIFGATVFSTEAGMITRSWVGTGGTGGGPIREISAAVDLDGDPDLEILAGNTAYQPDGTILWERPGLPNGFPAVGDFDRDGTPEAVLVGEGRVWILDAATGATELGPTMLGSTGHGGPPTVADFNGDGDPEVGIAQQTNYFVMDVNHAAMTLTTLWSAPNHDLSSSVTGSTVFDFEGDGSAEVIYNDECFLWVYDGATGAVRFAALTTSFTGTEASLVADVDGDGHAEIVMISNGADPSAAGWGCDVAPWNTPDATSVRPAWVAPDGDTAYRGITVFRDSAESWVGTRPLWNQHTYHVTNVCDPGDTACVPPGAHGTIPAREQDNWALPWLNNFRQNVGEAGIFDAPDPTVTLAVLCTAPLRLEASVRNVGAAILPPGVPVAFFRRDAGGTGIEIGRASTTRALFPSQVEVVAIDAPADAVETDIFYAEIVVDPVAPAFRQCRDDNDRSPDTSAFCLM
jgi:hypothetical protein